MGLFYIYKWDKWNKWDKWKKWNKQAGAKLGQAQVRLGVMVEAVFKAEDEVVVEFLLQLIKE